ncbi:hypothetical protein ES703_92153 [subsurface metagenome]
MNLFGTITVLSMILIAAPFPRTQEPKSSPSGKSEDSVTSTANPISGSILYDDVCAPLNPTSSWAEKTKRISFGLFFKLSITSSSIKHPILSSIHPPVMMLSVTL